MADASGLRQKLIERYNAVFDEAVDMMTDELREAAPLGETGDTRRGIEASRGGYSLRPAATIRSTGKGGEFVETGTAPHIITPRNGRVLRFLGGSGRVSQAGPNQRIATRSGGVVFATIVHHPGTPARPWFGPAIDRYHEFLERAAARVR